MSARSLLTARIPCIFAEKQAIPPHPARPLKGSGPAPRYFFAQRHNPIYFYPTMNLLAIGPLGGQEIIIIFIIVLLLFGAKKIPELARGLGKSMGEFKRARDEFEDEIRTAEMEVATEKKMAAKKAEPKSASSSVTNSASEDDKEPSEKS